MLRDVLHRLISWRDRMLAQRSVQNLTVAVPVLRPVANRRARELFDLCIGFVHTQVVTACVELDLFEVLSGAPKSVDQVAATCQLTPDAAARLLAAATALKLFVRNRDGRYRLGELGAAFRGAAGIADIVRHNQLFYRDLADPVALLRGHRDDLELAGYWPYAEGETSVAELSPGDTTPYSRLMAATQPFIADDVLAAYDFTRHRALLDVGGGNGAFAAAIAHRFPAIEVGVFDLKSVTHLAMETFSAQGLENRAHVHPGDFHRNALPSGYDAISLIRILLDHDDDAVRGLLASVKTALPPGGKLLVAELMSGAHGAETISDAYFGLYLMAMGRGRPRSVRRICELLADAGFASVRPVSTRRALVTQLVVGVAP